MLPPSELENATISDAGESALGNVHLELVGTVFAGADLF
jgi:hypothetical protein